jgi:hypothetical protein
MRLSATGSNCARAQVWTLSERLLKLGARVAAPVRRMVLHLPASFPFLPASGMWCWHSEPCWISTASADDNNLLPTVMQVAYQKAAFKKSSHGSKAAITGLIWECLGVPKVVPSLSCKTIAECGTAA